MRAPGVEVHWVKPSFLIVVRRLLAIIEIREQLELDLNYCFWIPWTKLNIHIIIIYYNNDVCCWLADDLGELFDESLEDIFERLGKCLLYSRVVIRSISTSFSRISQSSR